MYVAKKRGIFSPACVLWCYRRRQSFFILFWWVSMEWYRRRKFFVCFYFHSSRLTTTTKSENSPQNQATSFCVFGFPRNVYPFSVFFLVLATINLWHTLYIVVVVVWSGPYAVVWYIHYRLFISKPRAYI